MMNRSYTFDENISSKELGALKNDWLQTLTSPQDGMWESFRANAINYGIRHEQDWVGYANVSVEGKLLQFYLSPQHMQQGIEVFTQFLDEYQLSSAIVGTNNPCFMSVALMNPRHVSIDTYLFRDYSYQQIPEKEGRLKLCESEDLNRIVEFCQVSLGAPIGWLTSYIDGLIERNEIFVLQQGQVIVGTCEVRQSLSAQNYADIGMVVSSDFRKRGFGTYLLNQAIRIAQQRNKTPICSTERDNIGSLKAIHACGFYSQYQLLEVSFN
ncbi:MAG: GNAT family N-acetyltransferase [Cytophagales bacterium]|nr:GNAT family N-acetyltransferase [Cytophagales bacterium]